MVVNNAPSKKERELIRSIKRRSKKYKGIYSIYEKDFEHYEDEYQLSDEDNYVALCQYYNDHQEYQSRKDE